MCVANSPVQWYYLSVFLIHWYGLPQKAEVSLPVSSMSTADPVPVFLVLNLGEEWHRERKVLLHSSVGPRSEPSSLEM